MPTKNVDTLALKAQVSWIRPSSKPMSSQNLRTRVDAFASQPCTFQHVEKKFNIAASHEIIVSLIYFLYMTIFGWDPQILTCSLCLHLNLQEELNTTEHKLLYDYLHFLTLVEHVLGRFFFGEGAGSSQLAKIAHGTFSIFKAILKRWKEQLLRSAMIERSCFKWARHCWWLSLESFQTH